MEQNQRNLLGAELKNSFNYLHRLFQAILFFTPLKIDPEVKKIFNRFHFELKQIIEEHFLNPNLSSNKTEILSPINTFKKFKTMITLVETTLKLDLNHNDTKKPVINLINLLYSYAQKIHIIIKHKSDLNVEYPRINLSKIKKEDVGEFSVHLFHLPNNFMNEAEDISYDSIFSLDNKRNNKYEELLTLGHKEIFKKNNEAALNYFNRALSFKKTAEVLTLIGWCCYILKKIEKAKDYCIKAIKVDSDYGPPYNDLGNYLLNEGRIEESLKWFAKAKKCSNYQNKEYPYINTAKAYMAKKNYTLALIEFEKASKLVPYNDEIISTIIRLKKNNKFY